MSPEVLFEIYKELHYFYSKNQVSKSKALIIG